MRSRGTAQANLTRVPAKGAARLAEASVALGTGFSLLLASVAARLALVAVAAGLLWLAVIWALT